MENVLLAEYTWNNVNVEELHDVKVLAAASIFTPANAKIRNLEYKSGDEFKICSIKLINLLSVREKQACRYIVHLGSRIQSVSGDESQLISYSFRGLG